MSEEAITTALGDFGRQWKLPPLAWVILQGGGDTEIQGYGSEPNVHRWVDALEMDETTAKVGKHRWAGSLGDWRVQLLAA